MKKFIAIAATLAVLVTLAIGVPASAGKTWHVDDGGDYPKADYTSIQAAINATSTSPGDTIIVHPGTYEESVYIHKNNITLVGKGNPIVQGSGVITPFPPDEEGIIIPAGVSGVTIDGFQVQDWDGTGIVVHNQEGLIPRPPIPKEHPYDNTIKNNTVLNCISGIVLSNADDNTVEKNVIKDTPGIGVSIQSSDNNLVRQNTILSAVISAAVNAI